MPPSPFSIFAPLAPIQARCTDRTRQRIDSGGNAGLCARQREERAGLAGDACPEGTRREAIPSWIV
jgi:hypothetical protein